MLFACLIPLSPYLTLFSSLRPLRFNRLSLKEMETLGEGAGVDAAFVEDAAGDALMVAQQGEGEIGRFHPRLQCSRRPPPPLRAWRSGAGRRFISSGIRKGGSCGMINSTRLRACSAVAPASRSTSPGRAVAGDQGNQQMLATDEAMAESGRLRRRRAQERLRLLGVAVYPQGTVRADAASAATMPSEQASISGKIETD